MVNVKGADLEFADFWDARPNLARIRNYSQAKMAPPWGVFGCSLAKAIAMTPPNVLLPDIVGTRASLNVFVAVVAQSGVGKGVSDGISSSLIDYTPYAETVKVGSGEGIPHMFARREKGQIKRIRYSALINVGEVDTLAGLSDRKGTTILPVLRETWMGEKLGFYYADPAKRLAIEPQSYRACLIAGVQPERAGLRAKYFCCSWRHAGSVRGWSAGGLRRVERALDPVFGHLQ